MNANASTFVPSSLLRKKKEAQRRDRREEEEEDEYFAIDVECVATGHTHNDRAVAQIAVVDERMRTLVNVFVKPGTAANEGTSGASTSSTIVSTIEPLTGITREKLDEEGIPFGDGTILLFTILFD
tara:strand:+ start:51 stop:428 length:378 start_codon:yes stop_codon:yes gene_type:complete